MKENLIPKHQQLLDEIEDAGTKGITRRELVRVTLFISRHRREEMIEDLIEANMIVRDAPTDRPYRGEVFWTSDNYFSYCEGKKAK